MTKRIWMVSDSHLGCRSNSGLWLQIIEDYFPKDNLQMVFVGKASEITPIVGKFGPVKVLEITEDTYY